MAVLMSTVHCLALVNLYWQCYLTVVDVFMDFHNGLVIFSGNIPLLKIWPNAIWLIYQLIYRISYHVCFLLKLFRALIQLSDHFGGMLWALRTLLFRNSNLDSNSEMQMSSSRGQQWLAAPTFPSCSSTNLNFLRTPLKHYIHAMSCDT